MKEAAVELGSMGYSYFKIEVWVIEGIRGKPKSTHKLKPQSSPWCPLRSDQLKLRQSLSSTIITCLHVSLSRAL